MTPLSEMQRDALSELFNIGMGNAASALSEMLDDEIILSVPYLDCMNIKDAKKLLASPEELKLDAVEQQFEGKFSGSAFLFFGEQSSLELVRRILGSEVSLEILSELEHEALKEVSNIILNACFGCVGDILNNELEGGIPHLRSGTIDYIMNKKQLGLGEDALVLVLAMSFALPNKLISGKVSFVMTASSMDALLTELNDYLSVHM